MNSAYLFLGLPLLRLGERLVEAAAQIIVGDAGDKFGQNGLQEVGIQALRGESEGNGEKKMR